MTECFNNFERFLRGVPHKPAQRRKGVRSDFTVSFGHYEKFHKTTFSRVVSCYLILKNEEWSYTGKGAPNAATKP